MSHRRMLSQDSVTSSICSAGPGSRKKVAVVGGGCAGIAALWALNKSHHDVYLYEASSKLGGYTNTVKWKAGKYEVSVDAGFAVLNSATSSNFLNFLKRAKVETQTSEITFSVSQDYGLFEWASTGLDALFCQRRNLLSPRMWRMVFDVIRFNHFASELLLADETVDHPFVAANHTSLNGSHVNGNGYRPSQESKGFEETIGEYLEKEGYSDTFKNDYLIPLTAALLTTNPDKRILDIPAVNLVRFMWNNHLLSVVRKRPDWLTLKDCGKSYIEAVMRGFPPNHLFLNTAVTHVSNTADGKVRVHLPNGRYEVYDHVILTTSGDEAYRIIEPTATPEEKDILRSFQSSESTVILHSDPALMPAARKAWSGWNYLTVSSPTEGKRDLGSRSSLTYYMNKLQHIPRDPFGDVFVTINPVRLPHPSRIQACFTRRRPLYTSEAIHAQALLPRIQNTRGISYAGAWTKHGFNEDAFSSGLKVAQDHLGVRLPFRFVDSTYSRDPVPVLGTVDLLLRVVIFFVQIFVVQVLERLSVVGKDMLNLHIDNARRSLHGRKVV
ncbi:hypothetical protein ACRALDRAFT_1060388 [Sodiomyces alcalophilus JCM 7366]|uniref:uncharacterized protein n=1 Tax=Sodiomyces alcalophilus JCM 7366 TaxID=591952 RepID=UPI0039B3E8C2